MRWQMLWIRRKNGSLELHFFWTQKRKYRLAELVARVDVVKRRKLECQSHS
jgi:hypothetical protein